MALHVTGTPLSTVYLKAFDVDDPTSDFDIHGAELDMNGRAGNDNLVRRAQRANQAGNFMRDGQRLGTYASVSLDAEGSAAILFETTRQPGDNFRVAAAEIEGHLNSQLQVENPDQPTFLEPDSDTQPAGFSGVVSPLLTVWRYLRIECDTMLPGGWGPDVTARPDSVWAERDGRVVLRGRWDWGSEHEPNLPPADNFYAGGTMSDGESSFDIFAWHIGPTVENPTLAHDLEEFHLEEGITLEDVQGISPATLQIRDDDMRYMPAEYGLPRSGAPVITDEVVARFIPAYIELIVASEGEGGENPNNVLPFELYAPVGIGSVIDDAQDMPLEHPGYWVQLVTAAFQAEAETADDPESQEAPLMGENYTKHIWWAGGRHSQVAVWLETTRDTRDSNLRTAYRSGNESHLQLVQREVELLLLGVVAHEIGHSPPNLSDTMLRNRGVDPDSLPKVGVWPFRQYDVHDFEENLMNSDCGEIDRFTFSSRSLLRFRLTTSWITRDREQE